MEASVGGQFNLAFPILNTVINPDDQDYATTIIEEDNAYVFNTIQGFRSVAEIRESGVKTDVSLMPWEVFQEENFLTIPNKFQTQSLGVVSGLYAQVYFQKAAAKYSYTRGFNKIDNFASYVGGLIGTILGMVFILNVYS